MFLEVLKRIVGTTPPAVPTDRPILIVDDEPIVREVVRRMLQAAGYKTLEAPDGIGALALAAETPLLLLIADVNMPALTGDEVARRFRAHQPDLNCLFLTGCVDQLFDGRGVLWDGEAFLEKPFTDRALQDAVSLLIFDRLGGLNPPAPPRRPSIFVRRKKRNSYADCGVTNHSITAA